MSPRPRTILSLLLAAGAVPFAHAQTVESNRGVVGAVEVRAPEGGLKARAQEPGAPVLVRVRDIGQGAYRVEFLGLRSGEYELAPLLERSDGRAADVGPLRVRIVSQLPPGVGTDVFGLQAPAVTFGAYYREFLWAFAAGWAAVPVFALSRRWLRRKHLAPPPPTPPPPTPGELLLELARAARSRDLSTAERGRLELLLLRCVRPDAAPGTSTRDLARAVAQARAQGPWRDVVLEVERWLHSGPAQGTTPERIEDAARGAAAPPGTDHRREAAP
ncbi:MAG: hypothetical protein DYG92_00240 [Leptolyngbya sp. PLA1]|nr:hypothetical protein [Leptolyngbya sp. PLA1]